MSTVGMLQDVVRSWDRWVDSARGHRHRRMWADRHPTLGGWSAVELRSPVSGARTDAMQAALVAQAQMGDANAAATLIVQLRPGLISLIRWADRRPRELGSMAEAEDEVLGCFGETMMRHPLRRRPRRIAANLLLDTRQRIWRSGAARGRRSEPDHHPEVRLRPLEGWSAAVADLDHPETIADDLDLLAAVAAAIGGLGGSERSRRLTAEVAYRSWILDQATSVIAADTGLASDAVRARLCRLRSIVRQRRPDGPEPTAGPLVPRPTAGRRR